MHDDGASALRVLKCVLKCFSWLNQYDLRSVCGKFSGKAGWPLAKLGPRFGVDETTVRRALVRVGVVMRPPARGAGDYLIGR